MPDRDKWIYGKGKSKTTGYYSDYRAATQGNDTQVTPDDWPWSKEYRRKYGKNVGVGKTVSEIEDPIAYMKRLDKERKDRESKYRRQVKLGTEWKTRNMGWFVVLQDASNPGKVRIQRFDEDGFSGHMTFDNIKKLVDYLIEWESELKPAKGTLDKFSKTARWDKGMKRLLGSNKNESMVFADQQTREEKNLLRKNRRKAAIEIDKALEAMELEEKSNPLPKEGTWSWEPVRTSPIGPVLGYNATGQMKGRAKIELRKVGKAKKWILVFDGKEHPMPRNKPSFDHAEGLMKKLAESYDVYTLIEAVVDGADPAELIEKSSYAYDIRHDQNIHTSPVMKDSFGRFHVRSGYSLYEAKKKRLPKAARDLLRSAQGYHPPQIKYISKAQAKYVDELLKRGWVTKTDPGSYQEGVRITKKGEEAYSKDEW